ncbi:MAG: chorismate mutase [Tissierellales bacterium]
MDDLSKLRQEIDTIDNELIVLFERRMEVSKKVADYKRDNKLPIFDASRENIIIKKNIQKLNNKSLAEELESFYKIIFKISKAIQKKQIDSSK